MALVLRSSVFAYFGMIFFVFVLWNGAKLFRAVLYNSQGKIRSSHWKVREKSGKFEVFNQWQPWLGKTCNCIQEKFSHCESFLFRENNLKTCEDMVYKGSATRGGQPALCPPSILEARTQLINMLDKVEHTVLDTIKDVEKKRKVCCIGLNSLFVDPYLS